MTSERGQYTEKYLHLTSELWYKKMACSASFFSRNSVFLSQQFSRNSVFQPVSAKFHTSEQGRTLFPSFRNGESTSRLQSCALRLALIIKLTLVRVVRWSCSMLDTMGDSWASSKYRSRSLVLNLACSVYFFSRNSIFLSQQFSQNSVFQPVSASRTEQHFWWIEF